MTEPDPDLVTSVADTPLPGEFDEPATDAEVTPTVPEPVATAPDPVPTPPVATPAPVVPDPTPTVPVVEVPAPVVNPTPVATSPAEPVEEAADESGHWLPSWLYDTIKFLAQILLPAVATLYFALAPTWNLPRAEDVVGTIAAVDTFLGVFLTVSKSQFLNSDAPYDGDVIKSTDASGTVSYSLALNAPIEDLAAGSKQIVFKVK